MNYFYSLHEVSEKIGIKAHRIDYAIKNGNIEGPKYTFINKRVFMDEDLEKLREYFDKDRNTGDRNV